MPLFLRLRLVQADARDLRFGERRPRDHRVVDLELLERAEQRVHRAYHAMCDGGVGELVGPGDVAAGVDVRVVRLQELVHLDGLLLRHRDAELLEPVALVFGDAPDRAQHLVERDRDFACPRARRPAIFSPLLTRSASALCPTRTSMPSARKRSRTSSETSGSSRTMIRGSISTCVTFEPRRAKPAPARSRSGRRRARPAAAAARAAPRPCRRSDSRPVDARDRRHERARAGGDHDGLVVSVLRARRRVSTSTVQGEVIFASPLTHSTPRPA